MKILQISAAALLATMGSAFAADLPSHRAPPVYVPLPVPVFTWTGFYVGGQVGYEFGRTTSTYTGGGAVLGPAPVGQTGAAIGGAHIGYNYELGNTLGAGLFGGGLVVGVEGDIEGSNNSSSNVLPPAPPVGSLALDQHKSQIEGSVRGRLGIAVDRALFYATGGAAFAQFKDQITNLAGPGQFQFSSSKVGWTVGGGVEYAVTPNWLLRAEYRYTDFGTYTNAVPNGGGAFSIHNVNEQKVEMGVSYLFSTPIAPVVARY